MAEAFRFDTPGLLLFATMISLLSALQKLQRFQRTALPLVGILAAICILSMRHYLVEKRAPTASHPRAAQSVDLEKRPDGSVTWRHAGVTDNYLQSTIALPTGSPQQSDF